MLASTIIEWQNDHMEMIRESIKPSVWFDPDLCTGCGNCGTVAPNIFKLSENPNLLGISVTHIDGAELYDGYISERALDEDEVTKAREAAENCPGGIIHIADKQ